MQCSISIGGDRPDALASKLAPGIVVCRESLDAADGTVRAWLVPRSGAQRQQNGACSGSGKIGVSVSRLLRSRSRDKPRSYINRGASGCPWRYADRGFGANSSRYADETVGAWLVPRSGAQRQQNGACGVSGKIGASVSRLLPSRSRDKPRCYMNRGDCGCPWRYADRGFGANSSRYANETVGAWLVPRSGAQRQQNGQCGGSGKIGSSASRLLANRGTSHARCFALQALARCNLSFRTHLPMRSLD